jgi:hypothetical protein
VISELAFTHQLEQELAPQILKRDAQLALAGRMAYTVANPECFVQTSRVPKGFVGQVIADTFAINGVPLVQADPDTFNGWQRVRGWLRNDPDGFPWLTISPQAEHLIRGLSTGLSEELHPDELASYSPALHALRFAVMSQPAPEVTDEFSTPAPEGTPLAAMQKLLGGHAGGRKFGEAR